MRRAARVKASKRHLAKRSHADVHKKRPLNARDVVIMDCPFDEAMMDEDATDLLTSYNSPQRPTSQSTDARGGTPLSLRIGATRDSELRPSVGLNTPAPAASSSASFLYFDSTADNYPGDSPSLHNDSAYDSRPLLSEGTPLVVRRSLSSATEISYRPSQMCGPNCGLTSKLPVSIARSIV